MARRAMASRSRVARGPSRLRAWLIGGALASSGCIANVPVDAPTAEVGQYPTSEFELANGMRVVLERAPDVGVASVVLVVGAGSADEPAGKAGVAHLAEHLVFETRGDGELPLERRLEARAALRNAATDWDATTYYASVPAASLEPTLALVGEVLARPLAGVLDADFSRQRDIVQNERRLRSENGAHSEALGLLTSAVFPAGFAYAHPVAGTEASLNGLSLADVRAFVETGYRPERATLAVSSPLEFGAQLALVQASFGPLAREAGAKRAGRAAQANGSAPPLRPATPVATHDASVASPTLLVGWPVPSTLSEQGSVPELLSWMAHDTFFADAELREVVEASANYLDGLQGGLFYVQVTLDSLPDEAPSAALDIAQRVAARLRRGLYGYSVSSDLLERYKRFTAIHHTYALEDPTQRTQSLAASQHYFGASQVLAAGDRQLRALTRDAVEKYIETWLSDERARAVLLRPPGSEARAPTRAVMRAPAPPSASAERRRFALPPLARGELQSWVRPLDARQIRSGTLANGMSVIVAQRPASVYHSVLVGFAGGETTADAPGVSIAEPWSLWRTRLEPSARGLSDYRYHTADSSVELMRSTGSKVEITLAALRERLDDVNIAWPPREFLDRLNSYAREDALPGSQLAREYRSALFGGDAYGRSATSEQVGAVQPNDIHRFRESLLRPENGVLVIVGNLTPEQGFALAEEWMGSWSKSAEHEPRSPAPRPVTAGAPRRIERDWPWSTRAQLGLGCLLDVSTPERYTLASALGGLLRRRLFEELREQLGASYSVSDRSRFLRGGTGVLEFSADVSYDHYAAADAVVEAFARGDVVFTAEELERDRRQFAASYNNAWSTTDSLARSLFRAWLLDGGVEPFLAEPERYFGVELAEVNAAARQCAAHAVQSLLADARRIERARRGARAARPE
ncbi:MAG TPA: insulinase family protein [Polyangiaceae bacterium]|nr:insulinase family protein [Polyangiaceae bacterium]